jgi:hypothetical protein
MKDICLGCYDKSKLDAMTEAEKQAMPAPPTMAIRQLGEILNTYRPSMGNPQAGVMCHSGGGQHMDFDKLGQSLIRPAVQALQFEWHGWHGFRRGIASNLHELEANDKVVQRILRHAKPHVTKERYIKALRSGSFGGDEEHGSVFGHAEIVQQLFSK